MTFRHRQTRPPVDQLKMRLGANLREARDRLGISQEEVAYRAEIHPSRPSHYELGEVAPGIVTLIRLAGALEVDVDDLAAGMVWVPPKVTIRPGSFDVPADPDLAAEAARLRAAETARPARKRNRR